MSYIQKVKSTLKRGVDVELSQRTVIVGPNGAGKTSVIQTMELATCGWAGDMEGRARVKVHNALARLFPTDQPMVCEAWLDDGTYFEWRMETNEKTGGVKAPSHNPPVRVQWPLQDLMAKLGSDEANVKAWLEEKVIGGLKPSDVLKALDKAVRPAVEKLMKETGETDFLALSLAAKKKAKNLRTSATRSENTVEQMMVGVSSPLLESEVEALQDELNTYRQQLVGVLQSEHDALREDIDKQVKLIEALDAEIEKLPALSEEEKQRVVKVTLGLQLLDSHIESFGTDECWVCGSDDHVDIEHRRKVLLAVQEKIAPSVEAHKKRKETEKRRADAFAKAQELTTRYKRETVRVDTSTEEDAIVAKLAANAAAAKAWQNAEAARIEIEDMREEANHLTKASENLERLGKDLVERKKETFEQAVSAFLPEDEELGVDLDSARVGIRRGHSLHSALSGAEWSRVLMALAATEGGGPGVRILAPEDRSWDKQMLEKVMAALSTCESQVVIMSTTAPDPVEGWTMVDLR